MTPEERQRIENDRAALERFLCTKTGQRAIQELQEEADARAMRLRALRCTRQLKDCVRWERKDADTIVGTTG